jgi:MFS family permease
LFTEAGLGNTQAIVHVIGDHYGLATGELPWLIAGYSLTVGTFILISGRFGDVFGYKRMLLIGFSWMAVWSLILGLSVYSNHVLFTFARILQGIGPAIMLPNGLAILGATYAPGRRKAMVFSIFGACAPTGSIIGSAFAGLFELGWWPWTYWSFAIYLVLITVLGVYAVPDPPKKSEFADKPMKEKIRDLDLPGAVTGVTALVSLVDSSLTHSL